MWACREIDMKKILFWLLLSETYLFANSLVGTWAIDTSKTKASLKATPLKNEALEFTQRFVLHMMRSLECSAQNSCIMTEIHKGNSSTGKYIYRTKGAGYVLEGNNQKLMVTFINNSAIKVRIPDVGGEEVEVFYSRESSSIPTAVSPKTVSVDNAPLLKKMVSATSKIVPHKAYMPKHDIKVKKSIHKTVHKKGVGKIVPSIAKERIVDIDIEKEKRQEKIKADKEYLEAIQEVE